MKKFLAIMAIIGLFPTLSFGQSDSLTLEQKAARMIIVGMRGNTINAAVKADIDRGVAGIILFEHNICPVTDCNDSKARLGRLCRDLRDYAGRSSFIVSVDQEGGRVNRLKTKYGFPTMISAERIGKINNTDTTRKYGAVIAGAVSDAGFNVNFTPCVDVDVNPLCPVIGKVERSYSDNEETVARHASIIIGEHHKKGVVTSLKHFPGHGSSQVDSHKGFTDVTNSWSERELIPFKKLIDNGMCDMVMVGHLFNSKIDPVYPATLSKKTIDGLLRTQLGWNGVVITDDMHMKAISENYTLEESLELAINAGIDLIILSSNIPGHTDPVSKEAIDAICRLVRSGKIPESRLDESIERVETLMSQYGNSADDQEGN